MNLPARRTGGARAACLLSMSSIWWAVLAHDDLAQAAPSSPPQPAGSHGNGAPNSATADEAADAADTANSGSTVSEVTVTGHRPPAYGAAVGDIKPELQLGPSDIQSFGVSTVTELLNELAPETRSDRGRSSEAPVILVNGRRISSLNEVRNIPVEAILRVDILPEEVSLKYGYTADQRVVNIVLRRRFHATTLEGEGGGPTEGGQVTGQAEADMIHIRRDDRLNLDLKYEGSSEITDASRGIIEPTPAEPYDLIGNIVSTTPGAQIDPALSALAGHPVTLAGAPPGVTGRPALQDFLRPPNSTDVADDRTLSPEIQTLTANAVLTHPLPHGVIGTINGTLTASQSVAMQGLPGLGLTIPTGDPFSPFSQAVIDDRYVDQPLRQYVNTWSAQLGGTLNKDVGSWRLSLTSALSHSDSQTDTDVGINPSPLQALLDAGSSEVNPFGALPPGLLHSLPQSYGRSITDSGNFQVLANGPLLKVPAGNIYVSAKGGDSQTWQASYSARGSVRDSVYLTRNDINAQLSLDVPIASRDAGFLPFLGELSINGNTSVDRLSDYGRLVSTGYGLNWTPISGWNFIVSHTNDQQAPTVQQLGGPIIITPNVPVFDYVTGQSVQVTQITGGNPALKADNRNVLKIGLTVKPFTRQNLTVTANYIKSDINNPVQAFPAVTSQIENAFPSRFLRNAEGDLIEFDDRPVNFARSERTELRWGFNYWRPVGPQPRPRFDRRAFFARGGQGQGPAPQFPGAPPQGGGAGSQTGQAGRKDAPKAAGSPAQSPAPLPSDSGQRGEGASAAAYGGRGFGGGGRRGFGYSLDRPTPGRLQAAVYHTIYFKDELVVAPGGPTLDLLNGAPASSTGGQYRNEIEGQLGFAYSGFGARLSADWKSTTYVSAANSPTGALSFSGITTLNARVFDNLGQQRWAYRDHPVLKGVRVSLAVENLLNQRITVRNSEGLTPLSYQPGYIDPVGRTVMVSFRKLLY
ncbi:MAG: TonB-dependent receptor [Caulobacteraceae bacterium]|nr:TonB-dependent receptor [Caulobacteraceae bacterium]